MATLVSAFINDDTITATAMQRPIVMQRPYYNPSSQAFAAVIFVLDN